MTADPQTQQPPQVVVYDLEEAKIKLFWFRYLASLEPEWGDHEIIQLICKRYEVTIRVDDRTIYHIAFTQTAQSLKTGGKLIVRLKNQKVY